jgi:hypothetical protein
MEPIYRLYHIVYKPALKSLQGNRGRMIGQGGHGFVHAVFDAMERFPDDLAAYRRGVAYKITLETDDEAILHALRARYKPICGVSLVEENGTRAGKADNENVRGITGLGIGPIRDDLIGDDLIALAPFR